CSVSLLFAPIFPRSSFQHSLCHKANLIPPLPVAFDRQSAGDAIADELTEKAFLADRLSSRRASLSAKERLRGRGRVELTRGDICRQGGARLPGGLVQPCAPKERSLLARAPSPTACLAFAEKKTHDAPDALRRHLPPERSCRRLLDASRAFLAPPHRRPA